MKDFFIKLQILCYFILNATWNWKREIWGKNLDSYYCCNGDMCGCQGITIRENWEWQLNRKLTRMKKTN
jgi:hypothetical protein